MRTWSVESIYYIYLLEVAFSGYQGGGHTVCFVTLILSLRLREGIEIPRPFGVCEHDKESDACSDFIKKKLKRPEVG